MSFSETSLLKKLNDLNNTQQCVQTLSLWLIHHRKHAKTIVSVWLRELLNEKKQDRKLTFIYLANDILQNSRKKGTEYMNEFTLNILLEAIQNTAIKADSKMRFTLERILNIWKDRKLFNDKLVEQLRNALHNPDKINIDNMDDNILRSPPATASSTQSQTPSTPSKTPTIVKRVNFADDDDDLTRKKRKTENETANKMSSLTTASLLTLKEEISKELLLLNNDIRVPDTLDLLNMLQDLEKSASSDALVRQKIAELPPQISDINLTNKLKDKNEAIEWLTKAKDALVLLDDYNKRLQDELLTRKQTALLMAAYIREQQKQLESDRTNITDWRLKLKNVEIIKNELQIHLKSLPDLKSFEENQIELPPLPSANDLFST